VCKCACLGSSLLIHLDGKPKSSPASPVGKTNTEQGHGTCLDCNKQFCQAQNLPICKDAKDDEVIATCYRKIRAFGSLSIVTDLYNQNGTRPKIRPSYSYSYSPRLACWYTLASSHG
jgi:hypothetical protein